MEYKRYVAQFRKPGYNGWFEDTWSDDREYIKTYVVNTLISGSEFTHGRVYDRATKQAGNIYNRADAEAFRRLNG